MTLARPAPPPPRAPWRWAWAGATVGLCLSVLLCAPAQWLARSLAWASQGQLQLQDARGTLWQGSAQLVLTGGSGSRDAQALPGRIHWTVQPLSTAHQVTLQADCCMTTPLQMRLSHSWQGAQLHFSDTPSTWPAALLSGLGAPWNTLQPEGDLTLVPHQLSLQWQSGQWRPQGRLQLTARDMASRLSTLKPMGTYVVELASTASLNTAPGAAVVTLSTVSGALVLTGQGQWQGQQLRFRGEARAAPAHEAALNNLLSIIGRRDGARSLLSWG